MSAIKNSSASSSMRMDWMRTRSTRWCVHVSPSLSLRGLTSVQMIANAMSLDGANSTNVWLDVDYVTITQPIQDMQSQTFDNTHPSFAYSGSGWTTAFSAVNRFSNLTGHQTGLANDFVTFSFTGTSVTVYGSVDTDHGSYVASLDGVDYMARSKIRPTYYNLQTNAICELRLPSPPARP